MTLPTHLAAVRVITRNAALRRAVGLLDPKALEQLDRADATPAENHVEYIAAGHGPMFEYVAGETVRDAGFRAFVTPDFVSETFTARVFDAAGHLVNERSGIASYFEAARMAAGMAKAKADAISKPPAPSAWA